MGDDYFFGVTLTKDKKELKWEPDELKENGSSGNVSLSPPGGEHCLLLKQAIITGGTKDEVNIVEVETTGFKTASVKLPILTLTVDANGVAQQALDLSFPDPPVVLRLIQGSGPVHLHGLHAVQTEQYEDEDDEDDDDEVEDVDEVEDEEVVEAEPKPAKGKKRVSSNSNGTQPTKKKKEAKEEA